ncbi:MAG: hypothetical protein Q9212_000637 [Teloschistes hypoglaucus]
MSEEDDEQLVTKPFKFVTAPEATAVMALALRCSTYNFALFAGFDARFPNQNQYECPLAKTVGFDAYSAKNETLLAKLCRLSQMRTCQGRRLQTLSSGV